MATTTQELLNVIDWLRGEVYPGIVGHELDDLGIVEWVINGYLQRYRGTQRLSHENAKHRVFADIERVVNQSGNGGTVDPPPPPLNGSRRLRGRVHIVDGGSHFADDTGPVTPVLCHAGDLLSRWCRGQQNQVLEILNDMMLAGYHGVRTWTVLTGSYWAGREVGPAVTSDYWGKVESFADALDVRGLRWLVSQGDMLNKYATAQERRWFMNTLADIFRGRETAIGVDAGNETWQNGESDRDRLLVAMDAFRSRADVGIWSLTSPAGETPDELNQYAGSVFDVHGYRGGRSWDKLRHLFSIAYEGGQHITRRLGIQSEPFGPGQAVSVCENKHELTSEVMCLAGILSTLSRQLFVYFCGPGVKSDDGERLEGMPGFWVVPAAVALLPTDIMSWPTVCHGGTSQVGRRVYKVPASDETRCDHAISRDGRFACVMYGPRWRECSIERPHTVDVDKTFGEAGRLVVGRL